MAFDISSIIISILCEIAFLNAFMFQGVVADISTTAGDAWYSKGLVVSILSFLAFAVQIFFTGSLVKASKLMLFISESLPPQKNVVAMILSIYVQP